MARDRDRAKARRAERKAAQEGLVDNPGPELSQPHREAVPGSLDHASREVDEALDAVVVGADGQLDDDTDDAELEQAALAAGSGSGGNGSGDRGSVVLSKEDDGPAGGVQTKKGAGRFAAFLRASWAELQRVQWPDRRQVGQGTAVVLGFVVIAGLYLGVADRAASELVDLIL